jgi:hypothetical protein
MPREQVAVKTPRARLTVYDRSGEGEPMPTLDGGPVARSISRPFVDFLPRRRVARLLLTLSCRFFFVLLRGSRFFFVLFASGFFFRGGTGGLNRGRHRVGAVVDLHGRRCASSGAPNRDRGPVGDALERARERPRRRDESVHVPRREHFALRGAFGKGFSVEWFEDCARGSPSRIDRFQRRGRSAVRSEWRLITATPNLLKLHKHQIAAVGA